MVVFLADRSNLRARQVHRRIRNRLRTDDRFRAVQFRVAEPREPGPYRVVARTDPRELFDDDAYPVADGRVEVGVELPEHVDGEHVRFDWIEPDRNLLVGWHRDDDHPDLGPVHLQVNHSGTTVERVAAEFLDEHPIAVFEARLAQLPATVARVRWEDGSVVGIDR